MRNWFGGSKTPRRGRSLDDADDATKSQLQRVQALFATLRATTAAPDLDALNEATSLVHQIEASVMKMSNADLKAIWRSQVDELHRELQSCTAHTLSIEVPATPAQPGEDSGALFAGLDVGGGLFSGLDLGQPEAIEDNVHVEVHPEVVEVQPIQSPTMPAQGGPLDLDLFSDMAVVDNAPLPPLEDIMGGTHDAPFPSAAPLTSLLDMGILDTLPSTPAPAPPSLPSAASTPRSSVEPTEDGARRKKRTPRRIGYARAQHDDDAHSAPSVDDVSSVASTPLEAAAAHAAPAAPPPTVDDQAPLEAQLTSLQARTEAQLTALQARVVAADGPERTARARVADLASKSASIRKQAADVEAQQAAAVAAEDFDMAAQLGTTLEGLRTQITWVAREARAAEDALGDAAARRLAMQAEGASLLQAAVAAADAVVGMQQRKGADEAKAHAKLLADLRDAEAAAAEHLAELRGRVAAKQEGIQQQQAALRKKIEDSTAGLRVEQDAAARTVSGIEGEVTALRAALAAKEAELAAAQGDLAGVAERIAAAEAKYDKSRTMVEEDQAALEADAARLAAEEASLERLRLRQTEAQAAADTAQAGACAAQEVGAAAVAALRARAASAAAVVEAEQGARALLAAAREAEQEATEQLAKLEAAWETVSRERKALAAQRREAAAAIRSATQRADAASRLLPDLERDKRAAAAAQDFAAAKRLAEEGKAAAQEAAAATAQAAAAEARVDDLDAQQHSLGCRGDEIKEALAAAKLALGKAACKRLEAQQAEVRRQKEAAEQGRRVDEAARCEAELQTLAAEARATDAHGLGAEVAARTDAAALGAQDGAVDTAAADRKGSIKQADASLLLFGLEAPGLAPCMETAMDADAMPALQTSPSETPVELPATLFEGMALAEAVVEPSSFEQVADDKALPGLLDGLALAEGAVVQNETRDCDTTHDLVM